MPTRKQRRREAKQKRHEYEFVYVDAEGQEVEPPPEEAGAATKEHEERKNGKPAAKAAQGGKGRTPRAARTPQPPSWERAAKRALILGAIIFALFYMSNSKSSHRLLSALELAVIYTALFIPFTYAIDRFAYRRFQARQQGGAGRDKKPRGGR